LKDEGSYVCRIAVEELRKIIGEDFGQDHARWNSWWQKNKEKFVK